MPAAPEARYVARFGLTERTLHWVHAAGFTGMTASGVALFLPGLTAAAGGRPVLKAIHLGVAAAWITLLLVISLAGDRTALRTTRRELEAFDDDDARWLRRRAATPGRFNAGQKSHAVAQAALAVLFVVSGSLLWLGERNNAFQFPGSIALHDAATLLAIVLVAGHLFLALVWPTTRPALRGIVRGTVRTDWARRHHPGWAASPERPERAGRSTTRIALAGVTLVLGTLVTLSLSQGSLADRVPAATPVAAPRPAPPAPDAAALLKKAQALDQAQNLPAAIEAYGSAANADPKNPELRAALGYALARSGDLIPAEFELREAVRLDPDFPPARLYLGVTLLNAGKAKRGRKELRVYLELAPDAADAASVRKILVDGN